MSPNPNYKAIKELHADHKMRSQDVRNYNANMHSVTDRAKLKNNFCICKTKFFSVTTALFAPLIWCVRQPLQNYLITCCKKTDNLLLKSDMVKPWAFKTVVQLSKPI